MSLHRSVLWLKTYLKKRFNTSQQLPKSAFSLSTPSLKSKCLKSREVTHSSVTLTLEEKGPKHQGTEIGLKSSWLDTNPCFFPHSRGREPFLARGGSCTPRPQHKSPHAPCPHLLRVSKGMVLGSCTSPGSPQSCSLNLSVLVLPAPYLVPAVQFPGFPDLWPSS